MQELTNLITAEKQPQKALQRVQIQVAKVPDESSYHLLLGQLLLAAHNAASAETEFSKTIELDSSRSAALLLLPQAQQEAGHFDDAASSYERLMRIEPNNPEPCVNYALLEERRARWQHAEQLYSRALELQANQPTAANNLSYLLLEHGGDTDHALALAQIARRGMPESTTAADTLAWAYYKKGIYGSAIDLLREATRNAPQNPTYYYHLGLAYQKSNQLALAKTNFQRFLQLDPKSPRADEIRQAMTELQTNQ